MHAKVFKSGNSQAVRLPREFRLDVTEVEIFQRGDELVLRPIQKDLSRAFHLLAGMPEDFMNEGRQDDIPQDRESF
jgi:antitoxin VapB